MRAGRVATAVLAAALGCAADRSGRDAGLRYPGELVPTTEISERFLARQRVTAEHPEGRSSFEAVLQSHGGELTLIGLTPFGTRAFVLRQRGTQVSFDVQVEQALERMPFPPRYVLLDVHRTFFIGVPGAPLADGEHTHERAGEVIVERWESGRLHRRTFRRASGGPAGEIEIVYTGGMAPGEMPETIELRNGWFGYRLTIETLSVQRL